MNQKEAVFKAVAEITGTVPAGEKAISLSTEQRKQVVNVLVEGFKSGSIPISANKPDAELKKYVTGLLDNWLRKDKRLNGNTKYATKSPGSRKGQGDAQVKEMRKLLKTELSPAQKAAVEAALAKRIADIKPAKTIEINVDSLPAELIDALGL